MEFNIGKFEVYGLDFAIKASGNPMRTQFDRTTVSDKDIERSIKLGSVESGSGHDNYLKGINVQFDIIAPLYWWKQAQRYHWFDFTSSQSTMHSLLKFDVEKQCVPETNKEIINIIKRLINEYNENPNINKWRELVASLPCGFCLGATMTTNYLQLKTQFLQRYNHKLKEWHEYCKWIISLPYFKELCLGGNVPNEYATAEIS